MHQATAHTPRGDKVSMTRRILSMPAASVAYISGWLRGAPAAPGHAARSQPVHTIPYRTSARPLASRAETGFHDRERFWAGGLFVPNCSRSCWHRRLAQDSGTAGQREIPEKGPKI